MSTTQEKRLVIKVAISNAGLIEERKLTLLFREVEGVHQEQRERCSQS